jgi:NRAMP (natural resistance-associated macrophage protein)-like metal ion transporter
MAPIVNEYARRGAEVDAIPDIGGRLTETAPMAARSSKRREHHPIRGRFRGHGYFKRLGPGIITGAADDDPSGIGTYSQVGASHGLALLWTAPFLLPLAAAVQEATARLALVTGEGLGTLVRNRFPRWILWLAVLLVASANTLNLGADLASMGASLHLLVPVPAALGVVVFAAVIVGLEVWIPYERYSKVLRWFALSLGAYVVTLAVVDVDWNEVLRNTFLPSLRHLDAADMVALTAIAGTTISPYLFFWQAAEEVEERNEHSDASVRVDRSHLVAMRVDVWAGMTSGVFAMFAIMTTAAVTLGAKGGMNISTAEQAASALEPLAGSFAKVLFALGIIGLGLLAVPVLAGSTAYAVAEAFEWNEGLSKRLRQAPGFYGVIIGSMVLGLVLDAIGIDPIRALYYAAIFNGVTAPPIILLILLLVRSRRLMGERRAGWLSTTGITVAGVVMTVFPVLALVLR